MAQRLRSLGHYEKGNSLRWPHVPIICTCVCTRRRRRRKKKKKKKKNPTTIRITAHKGIIIQTQTHTKRGAQSHALHKNPRTPCRNVQFRRFEVHASFVREQNVQNVHHFSVLGHHRHDLRNQPVAHLDRIDMPEKRRWSCKDGEKSLQSNHDKSASFSSLLFCFISLKYLGIKSSEQLEQNTNQKLAIFAEGRVAGDQLLGARV